LTTNRPRFADLPVSPVYPPSSSWGVFGDDDELGTVNLLGAEQARRGAGLVRRGAIFSLNWDIELPSPALFGRSALQHRIIDLDPVGTEDVYDGFYPQASSQWDALAHIKHPRYGYYNRRTRAEITGAPGSRNGIDHWARRGLVGRFVLADVARYRAAVGRPFRSDESEAIGADDLQACLTWEGVVPQVGDILLIRFGWIGWYEQADAPSREAIAGTELFSAAGIARDDSIAPWLWDQGFAAVAADNPALEVMPFDESTEDGYLHYRLIPLLGMAVGELFALDALAADCAADGLYEGLFTAAPLNKVGGSGSPANALAVK
jgi:kynurenine formamidase